MVDAANFILGTANSAARLSPAIYAGIEGARVHAAACEGQCPTPAQHPAWVSNWIAHSGAETLVAALHGPDGVPVFSLPLEIVRANTVTTARYMSGSHANGNFPAMVKCGPTIGKDALGLLMETLNRERPDIDLLLLERQAGESNGRANPLLAYPHSQSANPALAASLNGGFDGLLGRSSGKRKRKKHRSQTRKFEALGSWRRFQAETPEQVRELIDTFFHMKQERFRRLGIPNAFSDEGVKRFFRGLFSESVQQPEPAFVLHGLEVAGKLRAVTGSSICDKRIVCEFSSFADDDAAHASPGDFLFFENIREACDLGMEIYDFSVGDEPYKRLWCDRVETQFDCTVPLGAKGRLAAVGFRTAAEVKRALKSNDSLWQTAKKIRRSVAGE